MKDDKDKSKEKANHEVRRDDGGAAKRAVAAKHAAPVVMMAQTGRHAASGGIRVLAPSERRAQGKALREAVPRQSHAGWKAPKERRDPIDLLIEGNQGRIPELIPIRFGRMMQSPFTFYRGAAGIMAADLAATAQSGLRVQACGDA